jgi:hypothetical protein
MAIRSGSSVIFSFRRLAFQGNPAGGEAGFAAAQPVLVDLVSLEKIEYLLPPFDAVPDAEKLAGQPRAQGHIRGIITGVVEIHSVLEIEGEHHRDRLPAEFENAEPQQTGFRSRQGERPEIGLLLPGEKSRLVFTALREHL